MDAAGRGEKARRRSGLRQRAERGPGQGRQLGIAGAHDQHGVARPGLGPEPVDSPRGGRRRSRSPSRRAGRRPACGSRCPGRRCRPRRRSPRSRGGPRAAAGRGISSRSSGRRKRAGPKPCGWKTASTRSAPGLGGRDRGAELLAVVRVVVHHADAGGGHADHLEAARDAREAGEQRRDRRRGRCRARARSARRRPRSPGCAGRAAARRARAAPAGSVRHPACAMRPDAHDLEPRVGARGRCRSCARPPRGRASAASGRGRVDEQRPAALGEGSNCGSSASTSP